MLPNWMTNSDDYVPPKDGGTFAVKTLKTIGKAMAKIQVQRGHEKKLHLPAIVKLLGMLAVIVAVSVSQSRLIILTALAAFLLYICTWPAKDLWSILRTSFVATCISFIIFLPAFFISPSGIPNYLTVILKVFISVGYVAIFNHTTQWNHITGALRILHIPGVFIFTIDIALKYIVLLGKLINDLLTSLMLRSVGKNNKKYSSVGGVMGVTFLRGAEMNTQMYEAMQCRGFTDDYKGL